MIHSKNLFKLVKPGLFNKTSTTTVSPLSSLSISKRFCSSSSSSTGTNGSDKDKDNEDGTFKLDDIYKTIEKDLNKDNTLEATTTTPPASFEETNNTATTTPTTTTTTKKGGRPKGSKNKVKPTITTTPTTTTNTTTTPITPTTSTTPINNNNNTKSGKKYSVTFISPDKDSKLDGFIKDNPDLFEPLINNIISSVEEHNNNNKTNNSNINKNINNNNNNNTTFSDINNAINNLLGQLKQQQPINKINLDNKNIPKYNLTEEMMGEDNLLPKDIVKELDQYIIGQAEAKRAVSIALRNRWRRKRLDPSIRSDVYPKNILMVGPTGVGKTELARRLAKIVNAPFVKVEATKYTEVGYHGPDVDTIIRDLIEASIANIKTKIANSHKASIEADIEKDIISALVGPHFDSNSYEELAKKYRSKLMDSIEIEIDLPANIDTVGKGGNGIGGGGAGVGSSPIQFENGEYIKLVMPSSGGSDKQTKKRKLTVGEAREILERVYREKYTVTQDVTRLAIHAAEQNGIVFLDEIDKICTPRDSVKNGGDASTDGVQRDLLPIIEGCNVNTKYGLIDTSRILFIASGAFHTSKPSDLISELQGRLPIRVELKPLDQSDFFKILTEPKNNQIQQQKALLKTEDIELVFTQDALLEVAKIAFEANAQVQNLGARRLHGIIERIVEELSFNCDLHKGKTVVLDASDVRKHLNDLLFKTDLSKYII